MNSWKSLDSRLHEIQIISKKLLRQKAISKTHRVWISENIVIQNSIVPFGWLCNTLHITLNVLVIHI